MTSSTTLILDGIWGRPRRWRRLARRIEAAGVGPARIVEYNAWGTESFDVLGRFLLDQIDATSSDASSINIVAHSMGGLVTRSAHLLRPSLKLRRAVLMNSPLHGSLPAYLLPLKGVRQMRPTSDLFKRLKDVESQWTTPTMTIWTPGDLMIIPNKSSRWHVAQKEVRCNVPAHIWPAWSARLQREVVAFLQ